MTSRPRPIETAPSDEHVIGYHSEWATPMVVVRRFGRWKWCGAQGEYLIGGRHSAIKSQPLHWAPIPKFPEIK